MASKQKPSPDEDESAFPLPLNFFKGTTDTTWISDGTQHFVLARLKPGLWLQCHVDPRVERPEVVVNVLEETQRGWRDYVHKKFEGWHVHSCKISGVHIKDNKVTPDWDALD